MSDHTDRAHSRRIIPLGVIGTGKGLVAKVEAGRRLQTARLFELDNKSEDRTRAERTRNADLNTKEETIDQDPELRD